MPNVNPVLLREEIGRRLRAAREAAGFNLDQASADLDLSRSSLNRIENGHQRANVHLVRAMLELYGLEADDLVEKVRASRKPGRWKTYGISDQDFIALETGANRVRAFDVQLVPGLLQTADYARAVLAARKERRSEERLAVMLEIRLVRQDRLTDEENPLELVAVIDEYALRRPVGGPSVMRAQLRHLALVAELPTVDLYVLPTSAVTDDSTYGRFNILDFPDREQPSIAYVHYAFGEERSSNPTTLNTARLRFENLRSLALDPDRSVALIEQVSDELWLS